MVISSSAKSQRLGINHLWNSSLLRHNNYNRVDLELLLKNYIRKVIFSSALYLGKKNKIVYKKKQRVNVDSLNNWPRFHTRGVSEAFIGDFVFKPGFSGYEVAVYYHHRFSGTVLEANKFLTRRFATLASLLKTATGVTWNIYHINLHFTQIVLPKLVKSWVLKESKSLKKRKLTFFYDNFGLKATTTKDLEKKINEFYKKKIGLATQPLMQSYEVFSSFFKAYARHSYAHNVLSVFYLLFLRTKFNSL